MVTICMITMMMLLVTMLRMGMLATIVMARTGDGDRSMMITGDDKVMPPMIATMTMMMPFCFFAPMSSGERVPGGMGGGRGGGSGLEYY